MSQTADNMPYQKLPLREDQDAEGLIYDSSDELSSVFMHGKRPVRDRVWGIVFLTMLAFFVGMGIYAIFARNPLAMKAFLDHEYMNDPHNCPDEKWNLGRVRRELIVNEMSVDPAPVALSFAVGTVGSSVLCVVLGFAVLWFTKSHPRAMVFVSIGTNIVIFLGIGIAGMAAGAMIPGAVSLVFGGLLLALSMWGRESLDRCASLMKVAGVGVSHNLALVGVSAGLEMAKLLVLFPFMAFIVVSVLNGHIAPTSGAIYDATKELCYGADMHGDRQVVSCCGWVPSVWVGPYMIGSMLFMGWVVALICQMRLFTVSGTIAHWYFTPNEWQTSTMGRVSNSLKNACGPQFGSVCESSLVLTIVQTIRREAEQQGQQGGGAAALVACMVACLASIIERLTNFTTITMSITGRGFMDSASYTYDLLKRNMLSTVTVWWLPKLVVTTFAFLIAMALSLVVGFFSFAHLSVALGVKEPAVVFAVILGLVVFALGLSILAFFVGVLLDIIDTVYICFAMDCDRHVQTRPDVHKVYAKVPSVVKAVEAGCWSAPPPPYEATVTRTY